MPKPAITPAQAALTGEWVSPSQAPGSTRMTVASAVRTAPAITSRVGEAVDAEDDVAGRAGEGGGDLASILAVADLDAVGKRGRGESRRGG